MDTWDKLITMAEETTRCAKLAEANIKQYAAYWRARHEKEETKTINSKSKALDSCQ